LGLFAALQNPISDSEKGSTVCTNDHFKCFPIAVNGRPVLFEFTGIHCYDLQPRRLRSRFRAKNLREIFKGGSASPKRWQINRRRRRYQAATPRHVANAPGGRVPLKK